MSAKREAEAMKHTERVELLARLTRPPTCEACGLLVNDPVHRGWGSCGVEQSSESSKGGTDMARTGTKAPTAAESAEERKR